MLISASAFHCSIQVQYIGFNQEMSTALEVYGNFYKIALIFVTDSGKYLDIQSIIAYKMLFYLI